MLGLQEYYLHESDTLTKEEEENTNDEAMYVQVTKVDGDIITGTIGKMKEMSEGKAQEGETPPEMPEGEAPSGEMPAMTSFVADEETITFTISDTTDISMENSEDTATIEDITTDTVLKITLDKDNVATAVVITRNGSGKEDMKGIGGGFGEVTNGTAATTISKDSKIDGDTYSSTGDAEEGTAGFTMTGGSLTAKAGDMFYVTNTSCTIDLSQVALTLANDKLFTIEGNSSSRGWGSEGANGGKVICNTTKQALKGAITVDDISSLDLNMSENTTFEGTINTDGDAGEVNITMDSSSTWTLTGDSYITSFDGDLANVITGEYTLYINGVAAKKHN